jgi:hypothetical protein
VTASRVLFFAAGNDLEDIMLPLEEIVPIKYYPYVIYETDEKPENSIPSIQDFKDLGQASAKDTMNTEHFLIVPKESTVKYVVRYNEAGKISLTVDLASNPEFIFFTPAGVFKNCVIAGTMSYKDESIFKNDLLKKFRSRIKKLSLKVQSYYVCGNAKNYSLQGYRLTNNCNYPESHDIK